MSTIYLVDNGAAYCEAHLGATAKATGRDISGQPIYRVTPEDARVHRFACEQCGAEASLILTTEGAK